MLFLKLFRFFKSFVRIEIISDNPERLLNTLVKNRISVWGLGVRRGSIKCSVYASDYKKIRHLREKGTRTRIVKKRGLLFITPRYRFRFGMFAGFALFAAVMLIFPNFVWNVTVVGNERIKTEEILSVLKSMGVYEGAPKKHISSGKIRAALPLKVGGIAWAAVNVDGVKATVEISEADEPQKDEDEKQPCNLVAKCDGIIKKMLIEEGVSVVETGQSVAKGDLLASGISEYKDGSLGLKHSHGEVIAQTAKKFEVFAPFERSRTVRTGRKKSRTVLGAFGLDIPLFIGNVGFDYEFSSEEYRFEKNGMYFPFVLKKTDFYEIRQENYTVGENEAKKEAKEKMNAFFEENRDVKLVNFSDEITVTEKGVRLVRRAEAEENIAKEEILLFDTVN